MGKGVRRCLFWLGGLVLLVVVVLLFLPALAPHRSHVIPCQNNLKQIGLGLKMYAGDHSEMYPERLVDLGRYLTYQSRFFICPPAYRHHGSGTKPGTFETVDDWTDYVYISGFAETNAPSKILMYCNPKNHEGKGAYILFLDGHVEWYNSEENTSGETSFENAIGTIGKEQKP